MKYLLIILTIIVISGCDALKSHSKYILENKDFICANICSQPIDTNTTSTVKDTTWSVDTFEYILPDSLMAAFYFECDSSKQVILKNQLQLESKYGKLLFDYKKGVLNVTALYDTIEVKNKIIHELRTINNTVEVKIPVYVEKIVREKYIPYWIWIIITTLGLLSLYLLIRKIFT